MIMLLPIMASLKSGVLPISNLGDIYLLNTWVVLLFLNRIGFAANFDVTVVETRVNKLR